MSSLADEFFALHRRGAPVVLPNAWDAASAMIFEREGFGAIATSSSAMSWALGYSDGEHVDPDELFGALARLIRVARVPVTADIEAGYGTSNDGAVRSVERAIAAGAVGANLEDFDARANDLIALEAQTERIRAVKKRTQSLGVRFFLNARSDILLNDIGPASTRVERTIERLRAYAAAGADGVFAPGTADAETIRRIAASVDAPLNVLAGAQTPAVAELAALGVARVSVGGNPMRRTLGVLREIARELRDHGTFGYTREASPSYAELNAMFETPAKVRA
jgi:2-methylisocitrate lyase-like PEP mutase family enzyme